MSHTYANVMLLATHRGENDRDYEADDDHQDAKASFPRSEILGINAAATLLGQPTAHSRVTQDHHNL